MTTLAAIDIGSNAIRMVCGTLGRAHELQDLVNFREPVRLGADVFSHGSLSEETVRKAAAALKHFAELCAERHVDFSRVVATSALREARNRSLLLERATQESGFQINLISGEEEARLVYLAVSRKADLTGRGAMLIDVGGGSVEVSLLRDGEITLSDSVKMGAVRLLKMLGDSKGGQRAVEKLIREYALGIKRRIKKELAGRSIDVCVATGGNLETLGELRETLLGEKGKDRLTRTQLETILDHLQTLTYEERVSKLKLKPDRADVIVPAGVVVLDILKQAGVEELLIPGVGLKEGVLYDLVPQVVVDRKMARRKQVLAFARALNEKYDNDPSHAATVSRLALQLFDQTGELHRLGNNERLLLEAAALLHDIGQFISFNGHHKHTLYLVRAAPFIGLDLREKSVLANVARYHRKSLPRPEHEEYAELALEDRTVVCRLAALLRVADALDREHADLVKEVAVKYTKNELILSIKGEGDLLLDRWAVQQRADLFEQTFHRKLKIE